MKVIAVAAMFGTAMIMPVNAVENTPKQTGESTRVERGSVGPTEGMTKQVEPQVQPHKPQTTGESEQNPVHAPTNRVGNQVPPMTPGEKPSDQTGTATP